jgi:hypothetical protein
MLGKPEGRKLSNCSICSLKESPEFILSFRIRQDNPYIAIEEFKVVVIPCDQERAAVIPSAVSLDQPFLPEDLFNQEVQGINAIGTLPKGTENPEPGKRLKISPVSVALK